MRGAKKQGVSTHDRRRSQNANAKAKTNAKKRMQRTKTGEKHSAYLVDTFTLLRAVVRPLGLGVKLPLDVALAEYDLPPTPPPPTPPAATSAAALAADAFDTVRYILMLWVKAPWP
jgi:hypothetical protein